MVSPFRSAITMLGKRKFAVSKSFKPLHAVLLAPSPGAIPPFQRGPTKQRHLRCERHLRCDESGGFHRCSGVQLLDFEISVTIRDDE